MIYKQVGALQETTNIFLYSQIFEQMEDGRNSIHFGEYTVTQTSLEQVFLNLVRWQRESNDALS